MLGVHCDGFRIKQFSDAERILNTSLTLFVIVVRPSIRRRGEADVCISFFPAPGTR